MWQAVRPTLPAVHHQQPEGHGQEGGLGFHFKVPAYGLLQLLFSFIVVP